MAVKIRLTRIGAKKAPFYRVVVADGSGTSVEDVNKLLKQFDQMKKMMKQLSGGMGKRRFGGLKLPF